LPADAKIKLKLFPAPKSILEKLLNEGPDNSQKAGDETIARALEIIQPLAHAARDLGLATDSNVLRTPDADLNEP
jgi:hypothetical protein